MGLGFDHARAVKSDWELESVRDSVRINTEGFWIFVESFEVGRSEADMLAPCEQWFVEQGCGRMTMDMVLVGEDADGAVTPEFRIASPFRRVETATSSCRRSRSPGRAGTGSRSRGPCRPGSRAQGRRG